MSFKILLKLSRKLKYIPFEMTTVNWLVLLTKKFELPSHLHFSDEQGKILPFHNRKFYTLDPNLQTLITNLGGFCDKLPYNEITIITDTSHTLSVKDFNPHKLYRTPNYLKVVKDNQHDIHNGLICPELFLLPILVKNFKLFEKIRFCITNFKTSSEREIIGKILEQVGASLSLELNPTEVDYLLDPDIDYALYMNQRETEQDKVENHNTANSLRLAGSLGRGEAQAGSAQTIIGASQVSTTTKGSDLSQNSVFDIISQPNPKLNCALKNKIPIICLEYLFTCLYYGEIFRHHSVWLEKYESNLQKIYENMVSHVVQPETENLDNNLLTQTTQTRGQKRLAGDKMNFDFGNPKFDLF